MGDPMSTSTQPADKKAFHVRLDVSQAVWALVGMGALAAVLWHLLPHGPDDLPVLIALIGTSEAALLVNQIVTCVRWPGVVCRVVWVLRIFVIAAFALAWASCLLPLVSGMNPFMTPVATWADSIRVMVGLARHSGLIAWGALAGGLYVAWGIWLIASQRLKVNELSWWLDRLLAVTRVLVCIWLVFAALAVGSILLASLFSPVYRADGPWFSGSWIDGMHVIISQAHEGGLLRDLLAFLVLGVVVDRVTMQIKAKAPATAATRLVFVVIDVSATLARVYLICHGVLALIWLIDPSGYTADMMLAQFVAGIEADRVGDPLALLLVSEILAYLVLRMSDFIKNGWLSRVLDVVFGRVLPACGAVWLIYRAVQMLTQGESSVLLLLLRGIVQRVLMGAGGQTPASVWSFFAGVMVFIVMLILGLIALAIGAWLFSGDGSGGGGGVAVGGSGGGGGAGSMFSGGSGGGLSSGTTIRDRYGNVLAHTSEGGLFGGMRITDAHGNTIGHGYEGLFGQTYARMNDGSKVTVEDSLVGDDKIVRRDGTYVGRMSDDGKVSR